MLFCADLTPIATIPSTWKVAVDTASYPITTFSPLPESLLVLKASNPKIVFLSDPTILFPAPSPITKLPVAPLKPEGILIK